jgi:hypothetical protein
MTLSDRNRALVMITGIFLLTLLLSSWIPLEMELYNPLSDLTTNNASAISSSKNNGSTESSNSTLSSNLTNTTAVNGSISIITPQELQDRRHAPS